MITKLILTADGSHTLFVPELHEHYHSINGAIQESEHIFINAALKEVSEKINPLYILEIGFGTGLNALLTYSAILETDKTVHYETVEAFPLGLELCAKLNFTKLQEYEKFHDVFLKLHESPWNKEIAINEKFLLKKIHAKAEFLTLKPNHYHLIYFDAFAPDVQPELWSVEMFQKIYASMKKEGILITYSAKGVVKRALKEAGFSIQNLPGPPGKREITRAKK